MGVKVRTLPMDETDTFFELFQMAEEKHGFKFRDKPYFYEMQKRIKTMQCLNLLILI